MEREREMETRKTNTKKYKWFSLGEKCKVTENEWWLKWTRNKKDSEVAVERTQDS